MHFNIGDTGIASVNTWLENRSGDIRSLTLMTE